MNILGVLQARVNSTRLPNKVLSPILGKPMLEWQIERALRAKNINSLVVATTIDSSDAAIETLCKKLSLPCFKGSVDDVLDRVYKASLPYRPKSVVRLTGDCPLLDPEVIDRCIEFYVNGKYDYTSNTLSPTFPDGLDIEVMGFASLKKAWEQAKLKSEREHVTPYIYKNQDLFKVGSFTGQRDHSSLRWTVDEPADLEFVRAIYEELYKENPKFLMGDILSFLEKNPHIASLNNRIHRNEGYAKSLAEDEVVAKRR